MRSLRSHDLLSSPCIAPTIDTPDNTNTMDHTMYRLALFCILTLNLVHAAQAGTSAVAMPDQYGAEVAREILQEGGNAVDAAIAATFTLAVTYPEAGNIGGGGFMLSRMNGENTFLDFRERAPGSAERDMYLDEGGNFVQSLSLIGGKASGVPGTVRGMHAAHERYGSLSWKQLLQPAIDLARDGFTVHEDLALAARNMLEFEAGKTNFARFFGDLEAGATFRQPELARTLSLIAEDPESFYSGAIARQIVAQMKTSDGLISAQDLADYKAIWREPLVGQWREFTIVSAPPPSSGGFALIQLLTMRDFADEHFKDIWQNSPAYIHLLAEIEKRVYADRAEYLGDPDYIDVPISALLDSAYLKTRAADIQPTGISKAPSVTAGLEPPETTHFSIVDAKGNAVSLTYTLNWDFGSGVVVEGAGFLMNNEMDDFSAKPGVPNKFGVIGRDNNAIAPNKRMLSSMTPTLLLQGDSTNLVIGTPGGSTIFTSVFQVILNLYDYQMPLQAAVDATRYHHQLPAQFLIRHDQRDISVETQQALEAMGYRVEPNSWGNLGDIQAIQRTSDGLQAASDNRGRGVAQVFRVP
ncbi:MAG: gamma-glutamyltransferase [Halioglobus sp.]